jgi:P4 family phage/plasmid primase-like protien
MTSVNSFDDYLKSFYLTDKSIESTHTRIGNKDYNVYGGVYHIDDSKLDEFYERYCDKVFKDKKQEYLTEKQLVENGPILVDLDLHYNSKIDKRLHTKNHIIDLILLYTETIQNLVVVTENIKIPVFVLQKPNVNMLENKTKDGIHLIFGISMHKVLQIMLRDKIKKDLPNIWDDLQNQLINDWDTILDEGVTRGHCNWQLFGSRKPCHAAYELTNMYNISYNQTEGWTLEEQNVNSFDIKKNFKLLSARYSEYPKFEIQENKKEEYNNLLIQFNKKNKKTGNSNTNSGNAILSTPKKKYILKQSDEESNEINNQEQLDARIEELFQELRNVDYELKETHSYVMILPESFYGPGSYDKWMRVGWALKNTSDKMFLSWVKLSSKSNEFSYSQIPDLYEKWKKFQHKNDDGLTNRSIMYWAKNNADAEVYNSVRKETINFFINETIKSNTEFDFANVLYNIFKDMFVCASIKGSLWYQYKGHKWEAIDSGSNLRILISKDMHDIYCQKCSEAVEKLQGLDQQDKRYEEVIKMTNRLADICVLLKKTTWKNNIMKEAQELFYDAEFLEKLDQNPHLLCFNNGVIDFKKKIFRRGQPDDYISMSTNVDYIHNINTQIYKPISLEIDHFMEQLFPIEEIRRYMWEHLASCLIGTNENQTFNIYTGSGANGKSKLVDLISKGLGDYKGTVPLPLITQKRTQIGSTSSEIVQLKGKRLAVMQEPSKGDTINEGIMKEITGGDPIQGRALFKDMITFIPQFKLVVTTNTLFDIKSNDDGTWRRIRVCDFMSKFVDKPYSDETKFPKDLYPHQFMIDKRLDMKFNIWAPVFMAKLVEIGFRTNGNVIDCKQVLSASDEYRDGQDYLSEFTKDKIMKLQGGKIKKTELMETFRQWYTVNYGRGLPKGKELCDFMDKRYGVYKNGGWHNISIIYDEEEANPDIDDS